MGKPTQRISKGDKFLEFVNGGRPASYVSFCLKDFLGLGLTLFLFPNWEANTSKFLLMKSFKDRKM